MRLPRPINGRVDPAYLDSLLRTLEREVTNKADKQAGRIIVNENQPLVIIAPNGKQYRIGVDDTGSLTTTEIS